MSWRWEATLAPNVTIGEQELTPLNQEFPTQGDAESWLGEAYPDLLDSGVTAVSLFEDARFVYGPMGLEPEVG